MHAKRASVDRVFHALGDPTRRAILERLSRGPVAASHLAQPLAITLAAVIQHLQILEACGLVQTHKQGRTRTAQLQPNGLAPAERWLQARRSIWERRLDRLGALLDEEDETE